MATVKGVTSLRLSRLGLAAVSLALFAVVGIVARRVRGGAGPLRVDDVASRIVDSARLASVLGMLHGEPPWSPGLLRALAAKGLPAAAAAVVVGFAYVAWHRRDGEGLVLCLVAPGMAVLLTDVVAKPIVGRRLGGGLAYPSGHATGAAAVAVMALLLFSRWGGPRALVWFGPVALLLPILMGLALVRFGWHYPTDVVGGTAMGAATVLAVAAAVGFRWGRRSTPDDGGG